MSQNRALDEFVAVLEPVFSSTGLPSLTRGRAEALANVLLFVPLGVAGGWLVRRRRAPWVLLALAALAVLVEAVQYPVAGRDASLRDVLLNTLGGALGVAAGVVGRWWWRRRATASASS